MLESKIEKKFVEDLKKKGCLVYKFVSPGNDGVPDRIIVTPGGSVYFVELKAPQGDLSAMQKMQISRLRGHGARVFVIRGPVEAGFFVSIIAARIERESDGI